MQQQRQGLSTGTQLLVPLVSQLHRQRSLSQKILRVLLRAVGLRVFRILRAFQTCAPAQYVGAIMCFP